RASLSPRQLWPWRRRIERNNPIDTGISGEPSRQLTADEAARTGYQNRGRQHAASCAHRHTPSAGARSDLLLQFAALYPRLALQLAVLFLGHALAALFDHRAHARPPRWSSWMQWMSRQGAMRPAAGAIRPPRLPLSGIATSTRPDHLIPHRSRRSPGNHARPLPGPGK